MPREGFIRTGLAATVLTGATLFGVGVTGVAGVDASLERASERAKPEVTPVSERDCPRDRPHGNWRDS